MATVYVNTDAAAAGGDGSLGNPYKTLAEALTPYRLAGVTTTPVIIRCSGATQDPGVSGLASAYSLDHSAWEFVTSPTNKIQIYGDNTTGTWNSSAYHIGVTNRSGIYNQYAAHVEIYNVQLQVKMTDGGTYNGLRLSTANNNISNGLGYFVFANCIVRRDPTSTNGTLDCWYDSVISGGTDDLGSRDARGELRRWNCLAIGGAFGTGSTRGFQTDDGIWANTHAHSYNLTAAKCIYGFEANAKSVNCLATACTFGFITSGVYGSDYNAEDDGNGAPGAHSRSLPGLGKTFTFVDAANDDYRLAANDQGAKDFGTDVSGLGLFSDDILGAVRTGTWDIGAFEQGALLPSVATGGYAGWQGAVLSVGF